MDRKRTPPSRGSNSSQPYREDCWSDGETSVLIDAWGDRYIELNRGNIPQKQWQEVADSVNSRPCDARRPPRTDIQCKYRVDTLKKKYKIEKNKMAETSSNISQWQFFDRLEALVGSTFQNQNQNYGSSNNYNNFNNMNSGSSNKRSMTPSQPPLALPLPSHRIKGHPLPPPAAIAASNNNNNNAATNNYENNYDSDSSFSNNNNRKRPRTSNFVVKKETSKEEDGVAEMSRAIGKLAEIYEKVEMEKSKQMMELEKQRMEFAKSVEIQRMQMAVDMMKMVSNSKKSGRGEEDLPFHALNLLFQPKFL